MELGPQHIMEPEYRVCYGCGSTKLLTAEYFNKDIKSRFGFNTKCKVCKGKVARKWYVAKYPEAKLSSRKKINKEGLPEKWAPRKSFDDAALNEMTSRLFQPTYSNDQEITQRVSE